MEAGERMDICPKCKVELIDDMTTYNIDGIKIDNIKVKKCPECGEIIISSSDVNSLLKQVVEETQKTENERIFEQLKDLVVVSNIKSVREGKKPKLTQRDVAARMGLAYQRIYAMEKRGKNISIERALKLAYAMGVDINDIFKLVRKEELKETDVVIVESRKADSE
jgi:DNA-binding XRE family transcriptional regulator